MILSPTNCSEKMSLMKEMVTLNRKEQRRLVVLNQVETGKMAGREAVELLGLSLRENDICRYFFGFQRSQDKEVKEAIEEAENIIRFYQERRKQRE